MRYAIMKKLLLNTALLSCLVASPALACGPSDAIVQGKVELIRGSERGVAKTVQDILVNVSKVVKHSNGIPSSMRDVYVQIPAGSYHSVRKGSKYQFMVNKNRNRLEVLNCGGAVKSLASVKPMVKKAAPVQSNNDSAKKAAAQKAGAEAARKAQNDAAKRADALAAQREKVRLEREKRIAEQRAKIAADAAAKKAAYESAIAAQKAKQPNAAQATSNTDGMLFPPFLEGIMPPKVSDRSQPQEGAAGSPQPINDSVKIEEVLLKEVQKGVEVQKDNIKDDLPEFLDF